MLKTVRRVDEISIHESTEVKSNGYKYVVLRVPGGWIYTLTLGGAMTSTFVPYRESDV